MLLSSFSCKQKDAIGWITSILVKFLYKCCYRFPKVFIFCVALFLRSQKLKTISTRRKLFTFFLITCCFCKAECMLRVAKVFFFLKGFIAYQGVIRLVQHYWKFVYIVSNDCFALASSLYRCCKMFSKWWFDKTSIRQACVLHVQQEKNAVRGSIMKSFAGINACNDLHLKFIFCYVGDYMHCWSQ